MSNIVGMAPAANYTGYYLVGSDGGVFSFGSTSYEGSLPGLGIAVNDIVGLVPSSDDRGYFLVGRDGGVFAFGDATFEGSLRVWASTWTTSSALRRPRTTRAIGSSRATDMSTASAMPRTWPVLTASPVSGFTWYTSITSTPDGQGYWVINDWGQVFTAGDARWLGNLPTPTQPPIISIVSSGDGNGYWLIGSNGAVEPQGDATWHGSLPTLGVTPSLPIVGAVPTAPSAAPVTSPSQPPPPSQPAPPSSSPITIETTALPSATVGQPYSATLNATSTAGSIVQWQTVDANGNPVSYSVPAPGLRWGGVDSNIPGLTITGTPTQAETVTFTFEVTDSAGNTAKAGPYNFVIDPPTSSPLTVTPIAPTVVTLLTSSYSEGICETGVFSMSMGLPSRT